MSQQEQVLQQTGPWVLISTFKENTNPQDLEQITPKIQDLVDQWQSLGKMMWSGAFDDNKTGMAIFEATEQEANEFFGKYAKVCHGVLDYFLYRWDAMPVLSVLSQK